MAGDRFGFLERHGFMKIVIGEHEQSPVLSRFAPRAGLVTLCQNLFFAAMVAIVPAGGQR